MLVNRAIIVNDKTSFIVPGTTVIIMGSFVAEAIIAIDTCHVIAAYLSP